MKNIIKYPSMDYTINCSGCGCIFECDNKEIKMVQYKNFATHEYPQGKLEGTKGVQCPICNTRRDLDGEKIYNVQGVD